MIYFYVVIIVLSGIGLAFDFILRYTEKIKSFGMEKKLFSFQGKTIPVEKLLPENLTMVMVFLFVTGIIGCGFELSGIGVVLSLPCSIFAGCLTCFLIQYSFVSTMNKIKKLEKPKGELAAGVNGFLIEAITDDSYGKIRFEWKGISFEAPAMSVNGTELDEFEKVIIILEENGCYFVESVTEVYDAFNLSL